MIANNYSIQLLTYPDIAYDGTINENLITSITLTGEFEQIQTLKKSDPASQDIDARLGIDYNIYIDKDKSRISYNSKIYIIVRIIPSSFIYPNWQVLELKEVKE
jgi:hypothetical protein